MTDLLRRLAARATGHTRHPSTRPLLPPRLAMERLPVDRPGPSADEDAHEAVRVDGAALPEEGRAHDRETGKSGREERAVTVAPVTPASAPVLRPAPAPTAAPAPPPTADRAVVREVRPDIDPSFERSTTRHPGTPAAVPLVAAPAPLMGGPDARPSAGPVGGTPSAPVEPRPRPDRRRVPPRRETAQPTTRRREPLQVPVVVPLPGPAPVPLNLVSRAVESSVVAVAEDAGPVVTISIGRVEIRAVPPAGPASGAREPAGSSGAGAAEARTLSLGEFLRGTGGAR
ncbi:hypothetical protein ACFU53_10805 [Streptomyces sp. NPDC057474]|uniref:hypothetical protein n=1 Tax=Streptomyces sp. NPDC057474 TaxID=3346144 RepID=UPI0036CE262E